MVLTIAHPPVHPPLGGVAEVVDRGQGSLVVGHLREGHHFQGQLLGETQAAGPKANATSPICKLSSGTLALLTAGTHHRCTRGVAQFVTSSPSGRNVRVLQPLYRRPHVAVCNVPTEMHDVAHMLPRHRHVRALAHVELRLLWCR